MIRVELYEGARALAGVEVVEVEAATLGEALTAVVACHPVLQPRVIDGNRPAEHWRASHNGDVFLSEPSAPLQAGDTILLVSALAGG
ncbi:MAG: MoaD/ThiS family protein [Planctomycetota bacterium]|nr:MoaD/ThiS family protein [Planctomycetota bacterium]